MLRLLLAAFSYRPVQRWGPVSPHGVGTAGGFLAGAFLMARRAEPRGIPRSESYNAVTWGAVGALLGARGFYVIGHLGEFQNVGQWFAVWRGGLTMFGGFIGGLALGLWYMRRNGYSVVQTLEAAAPGFVVGVMIGRVGDILIADHLGRPTDFFGGYRIPDAPLAPGYGAPTYVPGVTVHHTAVYDLIGAGVLLGFLYWLERRRPPAGVLFATFALWYGLQRFVIDFTRNRELIESVVFGLSGSQWAGLGFAAGGAFALLRLRGRKREPVMAAVGEPVAAKAPAAVPPPLERPPAERPPASPPVTPPTSPPVQPPPVAEPPPPVPELGPEPLPHEPAERREDEPQGEEPPPQGEPPPPPPQREEPPPPQRAEPPPPGREPPPPPPPSPSPPSGA